MKNTRVGLNLSEYEMNILKKLDKKRNGTYFIIQYYKDCSDKINDEFKGNVVKKLTTMSVRKGIDYSKLKSVIEERSQPGYIPSTRKSNYHYIDKMLLKHNTENKYNVALFPNNGIPHSVYLLNDKPISKQELQEKGIMKSNFWKTTNTKPRMITLGLDKIVEVYETKKKNKKRGK